MSFPMQHIAVVTLQCAGECSNGQCFGSGSVAYLFLAAAAGEPEHAESEGGGPASWADWRLHLDSR